MKPLDDLMKEDLDDHITVIKATINLQHNLFDYDKEEMIEYVIKKLKEEK